jgi:hypothetical protein
MCLNEVTAIFTSLYGEAVSFQRKYCFITIRLSGMKCLELALFLYRTLFDYVK